MHAAENALLAKTRAMYARRLSPEQYGELLSCRTSGEVAAYLKDKTPYGRHMDTTDPNTIHRGRLENRLREIQSRHLAGLSRYAYAIHSPFYTCFLLEWETEQLERSLAYAAGHLPMELPAAPEFFIAHSAVDWAAVEQADSAAAWVQALSGTPYAKLCRPLVQGDGPVDMAALDQALRRYRTEQLLALAQSAYDGAERQAVLEQLKTEIDCANLVLIYRTGVLRRFPAGAGAFLLEGGLLTDAQLRQLLAAADRRAFNEVLSHTRYRALTVQAEEYVELTVDRWWFRYCQHQLRFTTDPSVAMLCYAALRRLELKNILHLIEGVRYGVTDTAAAMLIGVEK